MSETYAPVAATISEELMLARLAQSEQMREFFIQMWLENPVLADGVGDRVRELLSPLAVPPVPQKGLPSVTPTFFGNSPRLHSDD